MVTELISPVSYNPGICQELIKLEISSFRFSQLDCNEESGEVTTNKGILTIARQYPTPVSIK